MAQNLFALSQAGGGASETNKPLISFRAGKCTFTNGTVTPINKKGLVQVMQTPDSLLHFQWKDRTTGTVEDDLIIFPEEAQFVKATAGSARVLLLKFTSGRKLFFWLQEPKDDKDKEYEEKTNHFINNPPPPEQSAAGGSIGNTLNTLQGLTGMDESQLQHMFQAASSSPSTTSGSGATSSATPPQSSPLVTQVARQPILSSTPQAQPVSQPPPQLSQKDGAAPPRSTSTNTSSTSVASMDAGVVGNRGASSSSGALSTSGAPSTSGASGSKAPTVGQDKLSDEMAASLSSILAGFGMPADFVGGHEGEDLDLQDVLLPEVIFPMLSDDTEALKELFSHLPQGTQNLAGLRELLFSAQLGQTIDAFTHVVNSGHANALLRAFGLDPMVAGPVGVQDINGFIAALQQASVPPKNK